jgi:hypothetical protein
MLYTMLHIPELTAMLHPPMLHFQDVLTNEFSTGSVCERLSRHDSRSQAGKWCWPCANNYSGYRRRIESSLSHGSGNIRLQSLDMGARITFDDCLMSNDTYGGTK